MEQHFLQVATESKVAHAFTNFHMHEFVEKSKKKTAEGNLTLSKEIVWFSNGANNSQQVQFTI